MDFSDFLAELNIRLGDSDNFTFTPEEKTSALTEAFNDENVVTTIWDTSTTFVYGTYQYAIPDGLTSVQEIRISPGNSVATDFATGIPSALWEVIGSDIQFKNGANGIIPTNYILYLKGRYKPTVDDTIDEVNLQEYILKAAQVRCYGLLLNKKSMKFLKNDTSIAEIVTAKRDMEADLARYKQRLPRSYEPA